MSPDSAEGDTGLQWGWGRGFCPGAPGQLVRCGLGVGRRAGAAGLPHLQAGTTCDLPAHQGPVSAHRALPPMWGSDGCSSPADLVGASATSPGLVPLALRTLAAQSLFPGFLPKTHPVVFTRLPV